jgi:DeoR family fructose operon transcriptional repressor
MDMTETSSTTRLQHDRQHEIYTLALRSGSVEVADLADRFGVTTETIRRDLSDLQSKGRLRRVHGGAVPVEGVHHEPLVSERDAQQSAEKLRIAQAAAEEVPDSGTVIIDSGSTLQRLADLFPTDRSVHVITNSLRSGLALAQRGIQPLTILGGGVNTNTLAMVDSYTVDMIREMSVDLLFISCDGLSFRRGLTTPYRNESMVKRAMIEAATRVIAMADHTKLGNDQLFAYAHFDEIDVLITDTGASPAAIESLRSHEIDVRVV